jgi:hypothetical protein
VTKFLLLATAVLFAAIPQTQTYAVAPAITVTRDYWNDAVGHCNTLKATMDGRRAAMVTKWLEFYDAKNAAWSSLNSTQQAIIQQKWDSATDKRNWGDAHREDFDDELDGHVETLKSTADFFIAVVEFGEDTSENAKQVAWDYTKFTYGPSVYSQSELLTEHFIDVMYDYNWSIDLSNEGLALLASYE